MSLKKKCRKRGWLVPLGLAATFLPVVALADAASDAALEQEVEYIDRLSKNGYADFAPAVIAAAKSRWPQAAGVLEAATIRAELMGGKQDEVAKKIAARPDQNSLDTWLMKLELATSYFMYSKFTEADKLYSEFFKRFPKVPDAARKSYIEGISNYIAMLGKIDRAKDTLSYYKLAMAMSDDKLMARFRADYLQAVLHQAEEMAPGGERDKLIAEADAITQKMVWVQDGFFGDAINGMAHVKMLRGDAKGAQEMIKDYLDVLQEIHESYQKMDPKGDKGVLRMSPLPYCRYLIGSMLYAEVQKEIAKGASADDEKIKSLLVGERDPQTRKRNGQGAFNHLVQVYMNYPESQSASAAGELVDAIKLLLKQRYNQDVKVEISPEQRAKVRQQQYVMANVKFDGGDWAEAAQAFSKTISQNGLSQEALPAMRKMVECYVRAGVKNNKLDEMAQLEAETITAAMAEGFSGVESLYRLAGDELNNVAAFYGDQKLFSLRDKTYKLFFRYYPKHSAAVSLQMKIAKEKVEAQDAAGAEEIYAQVAAAATDPSQRDIRTNALLALVLLYSPSGGMPNVKKEMATATQLVAHFDGIERPGIRAATAKRFLGDAQRHQGDALRKLITPETKAKVLPHAQKAYAQAVKTYDTLLTELEKPDCIYVSTNAEKEEAKKIAEGVSYLRGVCMQVMPATGDAKRDAAIRTKAMAYFDACLKKYPKGTYAAKCLLQMGTLQAANGDIETSRATLARLTKDFPSSDEAKNSIPLLADSLYQMDMKSEAIRTYKQMFSAGGDYTPAQYLTAAGKLLEAGTKDSEANKLAIEACDCILKVKSATAYFSRAMLMRARALLADKKAPEAYKQVSEVLEKYGRTQVAVEANLLLLDVAGEEILQEKTLEGRNRLIGEAKKAVTFVTAHQKDDPAIGAKLNLAVAEVAEKAFESTKNEANAEKEAIIKAIGSAQNAYRTAMFVGEIDKTDPRVSRYVQKAYLGYLRLSLERARLTTAKEEKAEYYTDVKDIGNEYLETFPNGQFLAEVNAAIGEADL